VGRGNKGFHRPALEAWVNTCKDLRNPDKKMVGLLLPFTGVRNKTLCHIHGPTWFSWVDPDSDKTSDGEPPKMKIPSQGTCHRGGDTEPCRYCEEAGQFETKYDDGREIPLIETWQNHNRGGQNSSVMEELDLRGLCKDYFKITPSDYGNEMIAGDGISKGTVNTWLKEIAQKAEIGYERGLTEHSDFTEMVPDVYAHDMRGTFVMQLIRNNMQRTKLIKYTGHDHVSSLQPYEERVSQETDAREFLDHI